MTKWTETSVCGDCAMWIANRDEPNWMTPVQLDIWRLAVQQDGGMWVLGSTHIDCTHDISGEDCSLEEPYFSWRSCGCCRSDMGGDRLLAQYGYDERKE